MNLDGAEITWLGHATFLVRSPGGKHIVMDPWLTENPRCPERFRTMADADIITISHGHFDHMGDAAALASRSGATVVSNFEIASYLEAQGVAHTIGMNKSGTVELDGIRFTMVHAVHSSGISSENGVVYGGEAAGFVVTLENGLSLYHAGDTAVFGDMALIHDLYAPDIALLPIGGHFTMAPKEAAYAVGLLKPKHVIPMHDGTFDALAGTPDALRALVGDSTDVVELTPGETVR
jgi:L-ascorbate metabolism protein UlaG (beta-lactamase superfamily)